MPHQAHSNGGHSNGAHYTQAHSTQAHSLGGGSPSAGGLDWAGPALARGEAAWVAALRAPWPATDTPWAHPAAWMPAETGPAAAPQPSQAWGAVDQPWRWPTG